MKTEKVDLSLREKIKDLGKKRSNIEKRFQVILSFDTLEKRDNFLLQEEKLINPQKFDLIPSISLSLNRKQIIKYEKEKSIKRIEEDQQLFRCLLEISEILDLHRIKNSQVSHTGKNVVVGIIDDGINNNLPSIANISRSDGKESEFHQEKNVQITHGTIMASIIGNQFKDLENKSIGIASDVNIIDFNISNSRQEYHFSDILKIFDLIENHNTQIDILLISFSTHYPSDGNDILSSACNKLVNKDILIVCPAGNFGPNKNSIGSPGAAKNVITFGALTKNLDIAEFSGRGPTIDNRLKPDFCLPASKISIPISRDTRIIATGTSIAAALGVGLIALIKEYNPNVSNNEIYGLIKNSCRDLRVDKFSQGYGIPNIVTILEDQDLIHERILPYNYLIKKAIKIAIEFTLIFIALFYILYFFRIS